MEKYKAFIIDDEDHCRSTLRKQLEWVCPEVEITGEAFSVQSGLDLLSESTPDIIFLDIEMADGTGFDLINSLEETPFKLIFTTAFDEYALEAFQVNALAYLLKPIDEEELEKKVKQILEENKDFFGQKLKDLINFLNNNNDERKIALPVLEGLHFVSIKDIIRCQAEGNYCKIFLKDKKPLVISKTIKYIAELIDDNSFIRVHQSHLINIAFISKYIRGKTGQIQLVDGSTVPVSRSQKENFLNRF